MHLCDSVVCRDTILTMIYQECQALPNKIYVKGGEKQSIDLNCFLTNNDQSGGPSRPPRIISDSTFQITSLGTKQDTQWF